MKYGQSAFADTSKDFSYGNAGLASAYKSPELINYSNPLSVKDTNSLGLFDGVAKTAPASSFQTLNQPAPAEGGFSMPGASDMQGYAGLASSFAQLASLPGQLKLAKLQRSGLKENLNQAKLDNAQRATVRSNLANYRTGGA